MTMSKLHHRSARYEVQIYQEHTMSWKPIAHTNITDQAVGILTEAVRTGSNKNNYRVLDRLDGVHRPTIVAGNNSLKVTL